MNNRLRQIRQLRGMTIIDLHQASGVSHGHISDIETGKKVPGMAVAQKLAGALGTTTDALFPGGASEQVATSELTA